MNRLSFVRFLSSLGLLPWLNTWFESGTESAKPNTVEEEKLLYGGSIRGLAYYDYLQIHQSLNKGSAVNLKRDPDNPYDRYAIEVWFESRKLGYLPRSENKTLAHILDHGQSLRAEVRFVDPDPHNTWDGVYVKVYGHLPHREEGIPENVYFIHKPQ